MRKYNVETHALIFANGPYQLMVGLACVKKHLKRIEEVDVITYDMQWQEELNKTTQSFIRILRLNNIKIPVDFKKSDISNFNTYPFRAFLNHILFFLYTKKYGKKYVLIPKLYGSPERAIILASLKKHVYIYDDGFGIYLDPRINLRRLDAMLYNYSKISSRRRELDIMIYPRKPKLITYDNFQDIKISKVGYSDELSIIVRYLSKNNSEIITPLRNKIGGKKKILITLPRLSLVVEKQLGEKIRQLIEGVNRSFPSTFFLLKPHPRDATLDFKFLHDCLGIQQNWDLLPKSTWCQPVEVISLSLVPDIILSGSSTVGINEDLLIGIKVMVFEFLSFNLPYYNKYSEMLMKKAGTFSGITVKDAIEEVIKYFKI